MTEEVTEEQSRVSRRVLVTGTAWTVPAIMVASAAPAIAASPTDCPPAPSGNYGNTAVIRDSGSSTGGTHSATATSTLITWDNASTTTLLKYHRTSTYALVAGCCYTFTSSAGYGSANPTSGNTRGVATRIMFDGVQMYSGQTRSATWNPGFTAPFVSMPPYPGGATIPFTFNFCATETRSYTYTQEFVFQQRSTGTFQPNSDDAQFTALTITNQ